MLKLQLSIFLIAFICFKCVSQKSNEELILGEWFFCDTTFYSNINNVILLTKDENSCTNPENYKNGSLGLKNNGEFKLINYTPCGPPIPTERGYIIDGCVSIVEGKYKVEKNIIWIDDNKFNIDVIDEKYFLLRREIIEK